MSATSPFAAPLQSGYTRPNVFRFTAIGDSQTKSSATRNQATDLYPYQVVKRLQYLGANISDRNWGIGGNRTPDILGRLGAIFYPYMPANEPDDRVVEIPDILAIAVGVNDPFNNLTTADTTKYIRAAIRGAKYGVAGVRWIGLPSVTAPSNLPSNQPTGTLYTVVTDNATTGGLNGTIGGYAGAQNTSVWKCNQANTGGTAGWGRIAFGNATVGTPADLPARCLRGQRMIVLNDNDSTGGAAATVGLTATVTGAGGGNITVWQCRTKHSGVRGWGRISAPDGTTAPTHCKKILVIGAPYMNWSTGGDNASTNTKYSTYDDVTGVRSAQIAAASAESVHYVDIYAYLLARITGGLDTQGDYTSWHIADSNQHLNPPGQSYVADKVVDDIVALSPVVNNRYTGWIGDVTIPTP